jgi:hypothetical protein
MDGSWRPTDGLGVRVRGRTRTTEPTEERQRRGRRFGPRTAKGRREGTPKSGGPQRRSTRSPGELLLRPYGPPGRRSCGLPIQLPHSWRTWCSLDDPAHSGQPCMRTKIPSCDRRNCIRRVDQQAENPSNRATTPETPRLRGSWPGPDCDGSSVPGPLASPVDWAVSPGLTGQPKHASYHGRGARKQADAPGRGSDRGRPRRPWRVAPKGAGQPDRRCQLDQRPLRQLPRVSGSP